ncbi:MAG TPA: hypothetical protein VGB73_20730 [Pyrinomonadaceae bacterium]
MAEIFANYEVNRVPRWPRLLRGLAGAFVLHAILAAIVIYVPTVQSMLHLAGMFGDAEYVDEDYTLAEIRQRAVMIKLSPHEKLYYPPGYFSTNPAAAPMVDDALLVQEAAAQPPPAPVPRRRPSPRPTPTPVETPTPEPSETPEVAAATEDAKPADGAATASASPTPDAGQLTDDEKKAEEELKKIAAQTNTKTLPKINVKPFKDLLAKSKALMDKGELDLKGTIEMSIEADRNDDGTLTNITVTKVSTSDEKLKELAIEFVQVLSASRALAALEGTRHLTMSIQSTPTLVSAIVTTSMDTPQRAREMADGYTGMIAVGRIIKSGKDEGEIYKNTKIAAVGKEVRMTFGMSREAVTKFLSKQVQKTAPAS